MKVNNRTILLVISFLAIINFDSNAQILQPVKWSTKVESGKSGAATLIMTAKIDNGWHMYSQLIDDGGPIKTTFNFDESPNYELVGAVTEGKATEYYDKNFEMQLMYFSDVAVFKQEIKLISGKAFKLNGYVEFMVCDDEKCLPPDQVDFVFDVKL